MKEEIIGLVLYTNEKEKAKEICIKHGIKILYPEIFKKDNNCSLYAFNKDGIGLVGTIIMRNLKTILHGVNELEEYLINN